jgi:hypothetical protein
MAILDGEGEVGDALEAIAEKGKFCMAERDPDLDPDIDPKTLASSSRSRSKLPRPDETADIRLEVALVGVNGASAFDPPADGGRRSWVNDEKASRAVAVDGLNFVPIVAPE